MHIIELAKTLGVNARELDKALLVREYTDNGIVPDDIAADLLYLFDYYTEQLVTPVKGLYIDISIRKNPCIYFLFDGPAVTYVGKSLNLFDRLGQHNKVKDYDGIYITEVPRKDLDILELFYISKLLPRDNIADKDKMEKIRKLIAKI